MVPPHLRPNFARLTRRSMGDRWSDNILSCAQGQAHVQGEHALPLHRSNSGMSSILPSQQAGVCHLCDQVIHQRADVAAFAWEHHRLQALRSPRRIHACHQALRARTIWISRASLVSVQRKNTSNIEEAELKARSQLWRASSGAMFACSYASQQTCNRAAHPRPGSPACLQASWPYN